MDLHFRIDQGSLQSTLNGADIETIERFQEGEQVGTYRIKKMAAKFMVTAAGQPIPYNQALKTFDEMPVEEYNEALIQFVQAMSNAAIPKANGTPLNSPSEAASRNQVASPDGSSLSKQPGNGVKPPGKSQASSSIPGDGSSGVNEEISTPES